MKRIKNLIMIGLVLCFTVISYQNANAMLFTGNEQSSVIPATQPEITLSFNKLDSPDSNFQKASHYVSEQAFWTVLDEIEPLPLDSKDISIADLNSVIETIQSQQNKEWQIEPIISCIKENRYIKPELLNDLVKATIKEIINSGILKNLGIALPDSLISIENKAVKEISEKTAYKINKINPKVVEENRELSIQAGLPDINFASKLNFNELKTAFGLLYEYQGHSVENRADDSNIMVKIKLGDKYIKVRFTTQYNYYYRADRVILKGEGYHNNISIKEFLRIWGKTMYYDSVSAYQLNKQEENSQFYARIDNFKQLKQAFDIIWEGTSVEEPSDSNVLVGIKLGDATIKVKFTTYYNYYYKRDRVLLGGPTGKKEEFSVKEFLRIWDGNTYLLK
jgi:hypothetical protein